MRTCQKCGKDFPFIHKIDGKKKNLCNRKFCLECSPFGKHNTKKDPSKPTQIHRTKPYSQWTEKEKDDSLRRYYKRGIERKTKLINQKGGCCSKCGYKKCLRALTFHHRIASEKSFALTAREIAGFSWRSILQEAEKCDVLCYNCHMEIEDTIGGSKYKMGETGFEPAI